MGQAVVLLAEDEPAIRQLVAFTLQQENFGVFPACDAAGALQMFHSHRNVDVLLTDVQLGIGMNGVELAEHILKEKPNTKTVVISGLPDSEMMAAEKGLPFLGKPFLPNVLIERSGKCWNQRFRHNLRSIRNSGGSDEYCTPSTNDIRRVPHRLQRCEDAARDCDRAQRRPLYDLRIHAT